MSDIRDSLLYWFTFIISNILFCLNFGFLVIHLFVTHLESFSGKHLRNLNIKNKTFKLTSWYEETRLRINPNQSLIIYLIDFLSIKFIDLCITLSNDFIFHFWRVWKPNKFTTLFIVDFFIKPIIFLVNREQENCLELNSLNFISCSLLSEKITLSLFLYNLFENTICKATMTLWWINFILV